MINICSAPSMASAAKAVQLSWRKAGRDRDARRDRRGRRDVLCTADGVFVTPTGIASGRQEIETSYKKLFAQIAAKDFVSPVDQVQMLSGNTAIALGHWTLQLPSAQGYWTEVYELQGQDWNIRLHAHTITPPAAPPTSG
jgi:ketosteroid isomerase-like protein